MALFDYSYYIDSAKLAVQNDEIFASFKILPYYSMILEHVDHIQGAQYLKECWNIFSLTDKEIETFCHLNDKFGSPKLYEYSSTLQCSPTSLRYIFQSHIILQHMQSLGLKEVKIVELGCGYGGLFLALQHFAPKMGITIQHYACIDFKEVTELIQKYISRHSVSTPATYHDTFKFGTDIEGTDLFLISNYCFSEIAKEYQHIYRQTLLPKCSHGFLAWNMIDVYDIGKQITVKDEIPQTGPKNKFLYF